MHLSAALFSQMADVQAGRGAVPGSGPAALDVLARPGAAGGGRPAVGAAAHQGRQAGRLCGDQPAAPADAARRADRLRGRACRATTPPAGSAWSRRPARRAPVVARLNAEITAALERRADQGQHAQPGRGAGAGHGREAFDAYIRSETAKWAKVIKTGQHQAGLSEHDADDLHADVLIVGAGPVGLTLAMDLASRGVRGGRSPRSAAIAEPPNVKCNHVAARTMELFRRLGVAQQAARRRPAGGLPERRGLPHQRHRHRAHAHPDPVPRATATPRPRARTPGGRRRSRRTASTRSTWSRSCCEHAAAPARRDAAATARR